MTNEAREDDVHEDDAQMSSAMEVRVRETSQHDLPMRLIEVQGVFPFEAYYETVGFFVSVFDCIDDDLHPVFSTLEAFQEPDTIAYGSREEVGDISPGDYYPTWTPIGAFIPEIMLGAYGGHRQLMAVVRLVDVHANVRVEGGRIADGTRGIFWTGTFEFTCSLGESGYVDLYYQERRELQSVVVELAVAVAIADGTLDSEEIDVVQQKIEKWIEKAESVYDASNQIQQRSSYTAIVEDALDKARINQIDTDALLNRLRRDGDRKLWYEVIELCYDVMAADAIADVGELRILCEISDASGIDAREIEKLRDRKIVGLKIKKRVKISASELLGIDESWDQTRIKRHLRREYSKWNSRLNTVPEGKARQNAQSMLDMIGEAYKSYT